MVSMNVLSNLTLFLMFMEACAEVHTKVMHVIFSAVLKHNCIQICLSVDLRKDVQLILLLCSGEPRS